MTELLKIATWNVNSIRTRLPQVLDWIQANNIDLLLMQEIKCVDAGFPYSQLEDLGYNCYVLGQKTYNGVAIISRIRADAIKIDFPENNCKNEARFIEIELQSQIGYITLASVYVPNGAEVGSPSFQKKLQFLDNLKFYLAQKSLNQKYIIGGDFNVAPENTDIYSPDEYAESLLFTTLERSKIRAIKYSGFVDPMVLSDKTHNYTWWDYRAGAFPKNKGARIDYFLVSSDCINNIYEVAVDTNARAREKASDHAPVILSLN